VPFLEVGRRALSEGLVAALAVVEDFDVVEDFGPQLGLGRPGAAVDEFLLERREEALGDGVVLRCRLRLIGRVRSGLFV